MSNEPVTTEVVDKRVKLYGEIIPCFTRIAKVWSGILDHEVQPHEVPLMMSGLKLVRTQVSPDYSDNSDDVDGFMYIFRQIIGEDMVHARTPDEYWAQKEGRDISRDLARQSEFYKHHDRTIDAGPDDQPIACECGP